MATKDLPPAGLLRKLLDYNPDTGEFTWLERPAEMFFERHNQAQASAKVWNFRYAGKPAFTYVDANGYRTGRIFKAAALAHRVAWAWMTGSWPTLEIDHINGNTGDNRWANLREVDRFLNMKNAKMHRRNTSGYTGVSWVPRLNKWRVQLMVNRTAIRFPLFENLEDAIAARKAAEAGHGFTERHGKAG